MQDLADGSHRLFWIYANKHIKEKNETSRLREIMLYIMLHDMCAKIRNSFRICTFKYLIGYTKKGKSFARRDLSTIHCLQVSGDGTRCQILY